MIGIRVPIWVRLMPAEILVLCLLVLVGCEPAAHGAVATDNAAPNESTLPAELASAVVATQIAVPTKGTAPVKVSSELVPTLDSTVAVQLFNSSHHYIDYFHGASIRDLLDQSTAVVIGTMVKKEGVYNAARDVNDVSKPDPYNFAVGQVYLVVVEQYLVGNGPATLELVQTEGIIESTTAPTESEIAKARTLYEFVPLRENIRYLLFLKSLPLYADTGAPHVEFYVAPIEPWRFDLTDIQKVVPESSWPDSNTVFPPRPWAALLKEIQHPESIPTSTQLPVPQNTPGGPVPTYHPLPETPSPVTASP